MYDIFKEKSWADEKITRIGYVNRFTGKRHLILSTRIQCTLGLAYFLFRKSILWKYDHSLISEIFSEKVKFQVMVLVASETGHVYTFSTPKFKPILNSQQGRKLIRTCLSDETRNDDEDDINIDEVKVDQLEEINQSDENADYGDNDENDVRFGFLLMTSYLVYTAIAE